MIGLWKSARIVKFFAQRLQMQGLVNQIANFVSTVSSAPLSMQATLQINARHVECGRARENNRRAQTFAIS